MADRITLVLPLPPRELSPNRAKRGRTTGADRQRRRLARVYRHQVQLIAREACGGLGPRWPAAVLWPFWVMADRRRRDRDNAAASFKSGLDGLVDAGLLADDQHVLPMPIRWRLDRAAPRLVLVVERTELDRLGLVYLPDHVQGPSSDS